MFRKVMSNCEPSDLYINKRLNKNVSPVLIEDLQYLSSETIAACYRSDMITVPQLITTDCEHPVELTKEIKRLGDKRLIELQFGLAEIGVTRVERDVMVLKRDLSFYNPLETTCLNVSILHKLMWVAFRYLWSLGDDVDDMKLKDAILPGYDCHISRSGAEYVTPDVWVTALPYVTPESFEAVFGKFGTNKLSEIEALDSFERYSYNTLKEASLCDFDSDTQEEGQRCVSFHEIIAGYVAFKMIYGQDREGMSWYDHKYGHQPWIAPLGYEGEPSDEGETKASEDIDTKIVKEDDFKFFDKTNGVRGVPLSAYGQIDREHPVWWMKD